MDLEKQKLEIKGALVHFYRSANQEDYLKALENAIEEIQTIKNINYTRCCETLIATEENKEGISIPKVCKCKTQIID